MRKTVLITGGTGVVGEALHPRFAEQHYNVVLTSRSHKNRDNAETISIDLLAENAITNLLEEIDKRKIKVTHLINNFRNTENLAPNNEGHPSPHHWQDEYRAAVTVPYELTTALAKIGHLESVINITSIYGVTAANMNLYDWNPAASPVHYDIAKAAEIHLTKELAVRLAPSNIRVNAIAYGGVRGRAPKEFEEKYENMCPLGGMLNPEDLPGTALFLASNDAEKITGQTISVDGGWSIW